MHGRLQTRMQFPGLEARVVPRLNREGSNTKEQVMVHRMLSLSIVALALGSLVAGAAAATKKEETKSHEGTVVSASSGKLVMTGKNGKEHTHNIDATVKITIDGKPAKLEDLKKD